MKEWLESIVESLKEIPDDGSGRRLVSAVTIAYCFLQLAIPTNYLNLDECILPLLQMLQLKAAESKMCPDYHLLCSVLPKENRYNSASSHRCVLLVR